MFFLMHNANDHHRARAPAAAAPPHPNVCLLQNQMAARVTHAHFERYAQHRLDFVRNIAALAEREEYLEVRAAAACLRRRPPLSLP